MKFLLMAGVLAALAAVLPTSHFRQTAPRDNPVSLEFNFRPGDKFCYTVQLLKQTDVHGSQDVRIGQEASTTDTFAVQASAGPGHRLRLTYGRVQIKRTVNGTQQVYDSQDAATHSSPLGALVGGAVGKSLEVSISDKGEMPGIAGLEGLNKSIRAYRPGSAASGPQERGLSEGTVKTSLNQLFNFYPGHAVKPGDSWTRTALLSLDTDTLKLASTYQLSRVQNGVAYLQTTGQLATHGQGTYTGTQTGTLAVDLTTGLLLSGKLHRVMSGHTGPFKQVSVTDVTTTGRKL